MPAIVVLGADAAIAGHLSEGLSRRGYRVVATTRRERGQPDRICGVDVTDPAWSRGQTWAGAFRAAGVDTGDVAGLVNLITCKAGDRAASDRVNVGGVEAMAAARAAAARAGDAPLAIHLASVGEFRAGGVVSLYAEGKQAARRACFTVDGVDVVLTLGLVTGYRRGTAGSRHLRRALALLPRLRSTTPVAVSPVDDVAEAVAILVTHRARLRAWHPARPLSLVLAGHDVSRGAFHGLPDRPPWPYGWEPAVWRALARLEGREAAWVDRLGSWARIALAGGDGPVNHYRLAGDRPAIVRAWPAAGGLDLGHWRVVAHDRGAGRYLIRRDGADTARDGPSSPPTP